jgi:hypothetical protein
LRQTFASVTVTTFTTYGSSRLENASTPMAKTHSKAIKPRALAHMHPRALLTEVLFGSAGTGA